MFTEEQENANTKNKTSYDLKLFKRASCLWKVTRSWREGKSRNSSCRTARLRDQKSVEKRCMSWSRNRFQNGEFFIVRDIDESLLTDCFYIYIIHLLKASVRKILPFSLAICSIVIFSRRSCLKNVLTFTSCMIFVYIMKRKLHGGLKIWILFSCGKSNILRMSKILLLPRENKFISLRRRVISSIYYWKQLPSMSP